MNHAGSLTSETPRTACGLPPAMTQPRPAVTLDRELIHKYDVPAPRYTSYPTAPNFSDSFSPDDYESLLSASRASGCRLSLYVHLPFCQSRCFYCGCNVTITHSQERAGRYLELLLREIAEAGRRLARDDQEVVQIHFGGGTPTFFAAQDLARLLAALKDRFRWSSECEVGVEVDPRCCAPEHLDAMVEHGVNRLSVGLQDLDPKVQAAVNRVQSAELTAGVVTGAHRRGIGSVNVDLIYGLPHQTPESFRATVRRVVAMEPERVAVFNFAYLPSMLPHQRVIDPAALPSSERKLDLLETVIDELTAAGFVAIGMDHFARPDDPLVRALEGRSLTRNFQGYSTWKHTDLVGFGASAIGQLGGGYAQNAKTVPDYEKAIADGRFATCRGLLLTPEDELRRTVIEELMCHMRLDMAPVESVFGIDFRQHFAGELAALRPLADDGLVEVGRDGIEVMPRGQLLVRNVAMVFDAYLGAGSRTFSRTV